MRNLGVFGYRNRAQLKTDGHRLGFVAAETRSLAVVDDCLVLNAHNRATLRDLASMLPRRDWRPARQRDWSYLEIDDGIAAPDVRPNARRPFRQGNTAQNAFMRDWLARTLVSLPEIESALELFAGSGNFTDLLSARAYTSIVAVDSFAPAVEALASRSLPGVQATCLKLDREDDVSRICDTGESAQLLLLDPPREGFPLLGQVLSRGRPLTSMLYISCDLASFCRDAKQALELGWCLEQVQPVDLFPHTPHVELLTRWSMRRDVA